MPGAWRLSAILLLSSKTAFASAQGSDQVVEVATIEELRSAIESEAEHIELTVHLDLSSAQDLDVASGPAARSATHFANPPFRSFRGNCKEPAEQAPGASVALQPGQCVIRTAPSASLFEWSAVNKVSAAVWIDNVYIAGQASRGSAAHDAAPPASGNPVDLIVWTPLDTIGPALYLTNYVALIPDGPATGGLVASRRALVYGAEFVNTGDHGMLTSAPVTLHSMRFSNNAVLAGIEDSTAIKTTFSAVKLESVAFDQNSAHDVFVPDDSKATIYTDRTDLSPGVGLRSVVSVEMLGSASDTLPSARDGDFMALQQAVAAAGGAPFHEPDSRLTSEDASDDSQLSTGALVGIVIGAAATALVLAVCWCRRCSCRCQSSGRAQPSLSMCQRDDLHTSSTAESVHSGASAHKCRAHHGSREAACTWSESCRSAPAPQGAQSRSSAHAGAYAMHTTPPPSCGCPLQSAATFAPAASHWAAACHVQVSPRYGDVASSPLADWPTEAVSAESPNVESLGAASSPDGRD